MVTDERSFIDQPICNIAAKQKPANAIKTASALCADGVRKNVSRKKERPLFFAYPVFAFSAFPLRSCITGARSFK